MHSTYNAFYGNGQANDELSDIDEFSNRVCNPYGEDGDAPLELDIFVHSDEFFDADLYRHSESDACLDGNGNPDAAFHNPDENNIGAYGGDHISFIEDMGTTTEDYYGFGE